MTEKTNYSQLEFVHEPNQLISFLSNQCRIGTVEDYIIPTSEMKFLSEVYGESTVAERQAPRQSGGTTLLGFIGFYYLLSGRDVTFLFEKKEIARHFLYSTLNDMKVFTYDIEIQINGNGDYEVYLKTNDKSPIAARSNKSIIIKHGGVERIRGSRQDILLVDGFITQSRVHHKTIMNNLVPSVVDRGGKLIMNVSH